MALDPRIVQGLRGGIDAGQIIGGFQAGQRLGEEFRQAPLRNQLLEQRAEAGEQAIRQGDLEREIFGARESITAFSRNDIPGVLNAIKDAFPGDEEEQKANIAEFQQDPQAFINQAQDAVTAFESQRGGGGRGGATGVQQAVSIPGVGFSTLSREGEAKLVQLPAEDQQRITQALEAESQRRTIAAGEKAEAVAVGKGTGELETKPITEAAVVAAKGKVKRAEKTISQGVESVKAVPVLRRALTLLDDVKTGGFANLALRARQFAGVEGADEGELSSNLGKAVVSQLRETFGAAFTVGEGKELKRIEAGFGKSPATNRRLLNNLLQLSTKKANDAIDVAARAKDFDTAAQLQKDLEFELDPDFSFLQPVSDASPTGQPQPSRPGGVLNTDAQGNRAFVFPDGTFEEVR